MASLLHRALRGPEQEVQSNTRKILEGVQATHHSNLDRELRRSGGLLFFPAALSLIDLPPSSTVQRRLCSYLVEAPGFLLYVGNPDHFSRPDLLVICRILMKIVPRLDVAFVTTLAAWKEAPGELHHPTFLRVLDVLDELSPGGRLVMSLTRLLRNLQPALESKAALSLGRRVQNPAAIARQMNSSDSRVRANSVEALWGSATHAVVKMFRERLNDEDHRVVGNALMGLWRAGDRSPIALLFGMLKDDRSMFRRTAAWAMGQIADPGFRAVLVEALRDEDAHVRDSAERALARFPQMETAPATAEQPAALNSRTGLEWGAIWPSERA